MPFSLEFHPQFLRVFRKLDTSVRMEMEKKVDAIKQNPFRGKPLKGFFNYFAERSGVYRILYYIEGDTVYFVSVFKRDAGYKHFTPK